MFAVGSSSNGCSAQSGTFGFAHLIDLSPAEVSFLTTGSFMERLLFSMVKGDQQFLDDVLNLLMEAEDDDLDCSQLEKEKVRAVTRMLLLPSKAQTSLFRRRLATGPVEAPFEALVTSHQDRYLSNVRLLHSAYRSIPRTRAPPVSFFFFWVFFLDFCIFDKLRLSILVFFLNFFEFWIKFSLFFDPSRLEE